MFVNILWVFDWNCRVVTMLFEFYFAIRGWTELSRG